MKKYTPIFFIGIMFLTSYCNINLYSRKGIQQVKKENFHLYLLMGQSNMAGRGKVEPMDTLTHPGVYMLDQELNWIPARSPIHFDKPGLIGTGIGFTFGKIMADESRDIKIGLIPCAKGGSSINQWFRDSLHEQTNSYPYNEMIKRAKKAVSDGTLKGILWHQGESDTRSASDISNYEYKFYAMINSIKTDLDIQDIPVVMGELGHFYYQKNPRARDMNTLFHKMAESNSCVGLVTVESLSHKGDTAHFDSRSYRELGGRYARKMKEIQSACQSGSIK